MMKTYENLCQMLEKEICNIEQTKTLTKDSLELLSCIAETLDNIKHLMKEDGSYTEDTGMSRRMPYYDNMMSNVQRRDSMGRYMDYDPASTPMMNNTMGKSRDTGYSRDDSRKKMVRKLETLMDDTMSEHEREAIQDCINRIEQ